MGKTVYLNKSQTSENTDIFELFSNHLQKTDRAASHKLYRGDVMRFAEWFQGNLLSASPLDIAEYRRYLQEKGKKPSTVNRALVSLRVFYDFLVKQGLIGDNPAEDIKPVAVVDIAPRWLTRQEQSALMRSVKESNNPRDEAIIALMLHAGLRVSEVVSLDRSDITIGERSGSVTVRQGKGNKRREVPLNKTARRILSRWLEENPEGPLFPNRYGTPITARAVRQIVTEYAYHAKIKASPHTLRHTFCKNLIDAGVSIDQVAIMAGHSKLDVTKRYTAPSMQDLQSAVERTSWE